MNLEKKICFLINWTREINMIEEVYRKINYDNIFFVINDLSKGPRNNKKDIPRIIEYFKNKSLKNFCLLSEIHSRKKFKLIVSTGDLPINFISLKGFLKFIYAKTLGIFFQLLKLNYLFKNIFGREFTAGGKNANFFDYKFVEKEIGEQCIKFPNGLDRNIKFFPNSKWKDIFDIYFTSSIIEEELVFKKFEKKNIYYIGYPRFYGDKDIALKKEELRKEFNFDLKKRNILCFPNERIMVAQSVDAIEEYVSILRILKDDFNVLLRPHPKLRDYNERYFKVLQQSKIQLDLNHARNIYNLFQFSDLAIVDYGSSVLETIYLKKKPIIYEWPKEKYFKAVNDKNNCLDYLTRNKLENFNNLKNKKINYELDRLIDSKEYQEKINKINKELYGDLNKILNPVNIISQLYDNE